jgi:hypothetical protein
MPDKITVKIGVDAANQTVSKFAIDEGGHVTFQNDATAAATVTFADPSPLCQGSSAVGSVSLGAGESKKFKICDGTSGQQYKYTATVAGAAPEDPIFIIERKSGIPTSESLLAAGTGLLVGLVAGYLIARRRNTVVRSQ